MSATIICPLCNHDRIKIFFNGVLLTKRITYTDEPKQWDYNFITRADLWKCGRCGTFFVDGYGLDFEEFIKHYGDYKEV